ncbi:neutral amino acid transporter A-like [Mercenaria mercenaria]|uniref:neutral amino acid transporter A-like n=1 Tax=Mercenaria mercenaria TaxID=6596 RepID=UPI00234E7D37|nr:neutral amino acid transporter A-like [Mercenaria mercenaria]
MWIGLPGQLYLRMLRMMIVPLIICSVISGTASLDPKLNGKITIVSFVYIFLTNLFGTILGIVFWLIFQPGKNQAGLRDSAESKTQIHTQDIFDDLIRNIFPENLLKATFVRVQTKHKTVTIAQTTAYPNSSERLPSVTEVTKYLGEANGANLLGLIMACTVLGIAASTVKKHGKIFVNFFTASSAVVTKVICWFMWYCMIFAELFVIRLNILNLTSSILF